MPELSADRIDELSTLRAFGLGEFGLFGGGAWVAIGMLVMTILYRMNKLNGYLYASFLIVLLITGLFVARTSLTGLIALSLLLIPIKKNWKRVLYWDNIITNICFNIIKHITLINFCIWIFFHDFNCFFGII